MDNEPLYFEEINNASENQLSDYKESDTDDEIVNVQCTKKVIIITKIVKNKKPVIRIASNFTDLLPNV